MQKNGDIMRRKDVASTVKWTGKNKIYLQRLGFIDARSGKVRPEANMSGFINECITIICESGKHPRTDCANPDELRSAWIKYNVALKNKEIIRLQAEIVEIVNKAPLMRKYNEALTKMNDLQTQEV